MVAIRSKHVGQGLFGAFIRWPQPRAVITLPIRPNRNIFTLRRLHHVMGIVAFSDDVTQGSGILYPSDNTDLFGKNKRIQHYGSYNCLNSIFRPENIGHLRNNSSFNANISDLNAYNLKRHMLCSMLNFDFWYFQCSFQAPHNPRSTFLVSIVLIFFINSKKIEIKLYSLNNISFKSRHYQH
jgi:hypothetical protein